MRKKRRTVKEPLKRTGRTLRRSSNRYIYPVLGLLVIGAFLVRVLGQLDKVFVGDNVWYRGVDAWYHMRLADVTATHFPSFLRYDVYALFPNGHVVGYLPLNAWIIGLFGQLFNYETVGAFLPPILGALTLVPVYFIGKELFNVRVGLIASLLAAVLPGEFLHRTLLGFTDHHALEALLMTTTFLFFLLAYKSNKLKWMLLAGLSLGLYQLAWAGAPLFVLILGVWTWLEFLRRFKKSEDIYSLCKLVSIPIGIGLVVPYAFLGTEAKLVSIGALCVSASLWALTRYIKSREVILFALALLVPIGLTVVGFFYSWHDLLVTFFWKGGIGTVQEAAFLTPDVMFATYGISFFMMLGGLWFCPKNKNTGLFLVWSVVLLLMTLGQRRWGYYAVFPVALLASYLTYQVAQWMQHLVRVAVVVIIVAFMLIPNIQGTIRLAQLPNNIDSDWYVSLTWLEKNSPDPFPEGAYQSAQQTEKPEYGVLCWWDYGHWVARISKRAPTDTPTVGTGMGERFFTATTEESALKNAKGVQYVIVDRELLEGKWYAIAQRGGVPSMSVESSELYRLWTEQSPNWIKIFERGRVKIYERAR